MRHGSLSDLRGERPARERRLASSFSANPEPFERLFPASTTQPPNDDFEAKLRDLAAARRGIGDEAPSGGGNAPEIPAGYTYLGQFIIHDMTRSHFATENDPPQNRTTPSLDLDSVYGDELALCPFFYEPAATTAEMPHRFYLGKTAPAHFPANGGLPQKPCDLPRIDGSSAGITVAGQPRCVAPLIADARNDENLIISQLQVLFISLHNKVADHLKATRNLAGAECHQKAKHFMVRCYRQIVLHDYAKRLLPIEFHQDITRPVPNLLPRNGNGTPLEFVFAAGRVGHAMARTVYTVNDHVDQTESSLKRILDFSSHRDGALLPLPVDWVVDWSKFFEIDGTNPPQTARRISPFLTPALIDAQVGHAPSPAFLDVWRCYTMKIPTGQECATILKDKLSNKLSVPVLAGTNMAPPQKFASLHPAQRLTSALASFPEFTTATPLSYYIMQEAAVPGNDGRKLGPLGSYIFATALRHAFANQGNLIHPSGISTMPRMIGLLSASTEALDEAIETTTPEIFNA